MWLAVVALASTAVATRAAAGDDAPAALAMRHAPDGAPTPIDPATRRAAPGPVTLHGAHGPVLAYPGAVDAPAVVYLHGIHGRAENGCPWMRSGSPRTGWLLCPEPDVKDGPGWSWTGRAGDDARVVESALGATRSRAPAIAVGFSQGAYVALDLASADRARFRALVLVGADVDPDARMLAARGVRRIVLGATRTEPWRAALERRAAILRRDGLAARFVDLGRVGHTYVGDDPDVLRDAIAWAAEP